MTSLRIVRRSAALAVLLLGACRDEPTGPAIGTLDVVVSGVPGATPVAITVTSINGFSQVVTATTTLDGIPSGRYTLTAAPAEVDGDLFAVPTPIEVRLRRGRTVEVDVPFVLASGRVSFIVSGLPDGGAAEAVLHGPGDAERIVQIPGEARGFAPGLWTISVPTAEADGHGWSASFAPEVVIAASATAVDVSVEFALATGSLDLSFLGLPVGIARRAVVYGAVQGATRTIDTVSADGVLTGLAPGVTSVTPLSSFDSDIRYNAEGATLTVAVGLEPLAVPLAFTPRTGRIVLDANGLPPTLAGAARVTGPLGYNQMATSSDTLRGVPIGTYQVVGVLVADESAVYGSTDSTQVEVTGAATAEAALFYAEAPGANIGVEAAYLVQSIQTIEGDVPILAGRDALLRVFGTASSDNAFQVPLRVQARQGPTVVFETTLPPLSTGVPLTVDQSTFATSWHVAIPAAILQPGISIEVALDPEATLPEADRTDNTVIVPLALEALPPFRARFVPILFTSGPVANVTPEIAADYLSPTRAMLPVDSVDWDIRAAYVTNRPYLTTSDSEVWTAILGELHLLRALEGDGRHYMGIIPVGYTSGIAGIGYLGLPTSLSRFGLPSGAGILAHELGHNFNRYHAPCGGPGGVDASYPYPGAAIGVYGYDQRSGAIRQPTSVDLMSYCADEWISDYSFRGALEYRAETVVFAVAAPTELSLVISGRVREGRVELDPVFTLAAAPSLPTGGAHRLELRDGDGAAIYGASFDGARIPDVGDGTAEHFVFVIPIAALKGRAPAAVSVTARGRRAEIRQPNSAALRVDGRASVTREADGSIRVDWSDPAARGLIIRDAATKQILTIARGRTARLPLGDRELEVIASDGLRTSSDRVRPAPF